MASSNPRSGARARFRLLLAAAALLCLACQARPTAEAGGGILVVATGADFTGPNELLSASRIDSEVRSNLFLRLLQEQPDYHHHPPTFAPELARDWAFSEDRLTLTFALRDDVLWSDGVPVTAEDVRWTWQAQTAPEVGWSWAYAKEAIRDVEVVDPHTVRFHFSRAYPTQLLDVNEGFILPRHAWGRLPLGEWRQRADWFLDHLVVSGPFTIARWQPQQELVLAPNPRYFESGLPRLERAVFRVLPEESARLAQLLAGQIHVMEGIPPGQAARVAAHPELDLQALWSRQYSYIVWNACRPLFAEPEVRRALTLAIDRQGLIEALYEGYARIATSPILSSVWAHDDSLQPWPYDPQEARRLLAAQGWRDGDGDGILDRDGQPFRFELSTNTGNQLRRDALVLIQEQLRRAGIDAAPRFLDGQALTAANTAHDFDATLSGWAIDTSLDVRYAFHSSEIDDGYNFGCYANPEVDALIERIAGTQEPRDAEPLFHRLQHLLHREQPYTFLWEPQWLVGLDRRIEGASPNALLTFFDLERWHLRPR
ncbi:MAG TPA: ABC transporter substrate-binding protein [Thermoanaerobaculia bacterium]|nr:ABC transporter substrate-binding protein [Thermoanaerobaculia bacterium]